MWEWVSGRSQRYARRRPAVGPFWQAPFAMIDNGLGFQLVPWSRELEKRLGQHVTGVVKDGGGIEWGFGRKRDLGL